MKKRACTLFLSVIALQFAGAADLPTTSEGDVPPDAAAPTSGTVGAADGQAPSAPKIELKNKSSFAMEDTSRNPFWPIGWKPAPKPSSATTEAAGPSILPTAFRVTSITLGGGTRFAIINGKVMTEGQVFGLQMGSQTYQITVKSIEDGRVILLRRDEEIAVPLFRR